MTGYLQKITNVRREELLPILAAAFFFFCILTALMILRPARDALGMERGIETIRWLFVGTAVVTLLVNPVFGWLVSQFRRLTFITATYLFFGGNLLLFCGLLVLAPQAVGEVTGMVFYVWMSVFNLFVTMVFWALMADRFSLEQSKRLFGVIAVGGTTGAIFGSSLAAVLTNVIGAPMLLVIATAFLVLALAGAWAVALLQPEPQDIANKSDPSAPDAPPVVSEQAIIGGSAIDGFRRALRSPYLLGISSYVLILAVMATFLYFTRLQMVEVLGDDTDTRAAIFARIDLATQVATLILQLIVTGHLMKRFGVHITLALLPITVALGFIGLAIVSTIVALVVFEAVFRAVQRAIMRPARETLFTVVSREDKYKSKAFVDTFVYRSGDVLGAWMEGVLGRLAMGLTALAAVAVPLAMVWMVLGIWLGRRQQKLARHDPSLRGKEIAELTAEPEAAR